MGNKVMSFSAKQFSRGFLAFLVSFMLTGCIAQGDTVEDETRFYVLGSLPSSTEALPGAPDSPPLVVDLTSLRLPQYLQRAQIVTRVDANRLSLSEFDQWGGNLEKNMLRAVATNLAVLLRTSEIHIAARRTTVGVDAQVEIDVIQFERGPDGRAILSAQWRVLGRDENETLVSQITNLTSGPVGARDTLATTVAAMSELLADLSRQIAVAIIEHRSTT